MLEKIINAVACGLLITLFFWVGIELAKLDADPNTYCKRRIAALTLEELEVCKARLHTKKGP